MATAHPVPDQALLDDVRTALAAAGDPVRAQGQQRYLKSELPCHGITAPELRRLLRPLLAAHPLRDRERWEASVRALHDEATHREQRYAALELLRHPAYAPYRDVETLPLLEHLVTQGAWWDLVDPCQPVVTRILLAEPGPAGAWLRSWSTDEDHWLRRSAIIGQLGAKDRTDTALLREVIEANLDDREFFIRKAIGWALRQHARTDPGWVLAFVDAHRAALSPLSTREALKHLDQPR